MEKMLFLAKAATACCWLWAISGSLGLAVPGARFAPLIAVVLLLTHCLEVPLLAKRLKAQGPLRAHAVGILVFGVFYYLSRRSAPVAENGG